MCTSHSFIIDADGLSYRVSQGQPGPISLARTPQILMIRPPPAEHLSIRLLKPCSFFLLRVSLLLSLYKLFSATALTSTPPSHLQGLSRCAEFSRATSMSIATFFLFSPARDCPAEETCERLTIARKVIPMCKNLSLPRCGWRNGKDIPGQRLRNSTDCEIEPSPPRTGLE